jgi:hypothetical protein
VTKRDKASPASSDSFYRVEIVKKVSGEQVVVLEKDLSTHRSKMAFT